MNVLSKIVVIAATLWMCGCGDRGGHSGLSFDSPVIYADVPGISVVRVGDEFYMVSTTM